MSFEIYLRFVGYSHFIFGTCLLLSCIYFSKADVVFLVDL